MSSGDILSDSSSSTGSERQYPRARHLMSSPLKEAAIFSDHIGSGSSNGHRKRNYHTSFDDRVSSSGSNKRFRSSPVAGRSIHPSRASSFHQLTRSSPIKPRKSHFTTSSGPGLSFYEIPELHATNYAATSDDEDNTLPTHSFNITSSPPRTPPRNRGALNRRKQDKSEKSEEGADLLLYLATSPSPANPTSRVRMQPPSTPPPKNLALPSSMMTTPGGTGAFISAFPNTPSQNFDFSDFVNITPSPAQGAWNRTPGTIKTPATVTRRRLTFENFIPQFPTSPNPNGKQTGLGMQLGGNLIS